MKTAPPRMRRLPVPIEALVDIFVNERPDRPSYLDRLTGALVIDRDSDSDLAMVIDREIGPRYLSIPCAGMRDVYRCAEAFAADQTDPRLNGLLHRALVDVAELDKFYAVLSMQPALMERWQRFRRNCLRALVISWLRSEAIEVG